MFQVRDGVLADRQSFYLENAARRDEAEVAEEFVLQYYATALSTPPQVIVQRSVRDTDMLAEALNERRGAPVEVRHAERGDKRRILELAERNARLALDQDRLRSERRRSQRIEALDGLQRALGMEVIPMRIECFDISNLMHAHTVASMVVFEGGAPKKSDYRRFGIREAVQDDFAAMGEVLSRRMAQFVAQRERSPHDKDYDVSFASVPALIVIDGGGASSRPDSRSSSRSATSGRPWSASRSGSRRSSCPASPGRSCSTTTRLSSSSSSGSATRPTGSRSSSTAAAVTRR